jgi:carbon monoxide dehydrogenase subunit G
MKVEGRHALPGTRESVWSRLMDPEVLTRCLPGCEKLEPDRENTYRASIKLGLASIKGAYSGSLALEDVKPPESYRLILEGKGSPGFVKGSATVVLTEQAQGTELAYSGDSMVGGPIASIGQRVLQGLANTLIRHFFAALEREIRGESGVDTEAAGATPEAEIQSGPAG